MIKKYLIYPIFIAIFISFSNLNYLFSDDLISKIEEIKKKGVFEVAIYSKDIAPFFMHNAQGTLVGFDVDIAKDIARRLQVEVKFNKKSKTYNEVIELVAKGDVDAGISFLSNTLSQVQKVYFTDNYMVVKQTLVINRKMRASHENNNIFTLLNQRKMTIGVLEGSSYIEYARDSFPDVSLMLFKNYNMLYEAVIDKKVIAVLTDSVNIKNWFLKKPETALYLQTKILNDKADPISIAVNWKNTHFLLWLNLYLQQIKIDGTMKMLTEKYFINIK